jgi:hypothetical protein
MKTHLNTVGIMLTLIGALLIWFFIGEVNFAKKDEYLKGHGGLEIPDPTPEDIKKLKRNIFLSRMGMALIVVGGFLEILSNYYCDP